MQSCTFREWIDTSCADPGIVRQVETKGQYYVRMGEAREAARHALEEQERRIRQQLIRLKGKEDELSRRREALGAREAALKRQEGEFEARQAQLRMEDERQTSKKSQDGQRSQFGENTAKKTKEGKISKFDLVD